MIRLVRTGPSPARQGIRRFRWPWLHFCLWDQECRQWGAPKDVYVLPLGVAFRFGEGETLARFDELGAGKDG